MISVVQAQCIVTVARLGSFRKAAAELFMAQPAVSAHVYKAERELRAVLFDRTATGAVLTVHGAALLTHFESLLVHHDSVMHASADIQAGNVGTLRVACHRVAQVQTLPNALMLLRAVVGPVVVDVTQAEEDTAGELVRSGAAELAVGVRIRNERNPDSSLYEVITSSSPVVVYMRDDHPLAAQATITLADLLTDTLIATRSPVASRLYAAKLGDLSTVSRVVVDDAQLVLQMVGDGVGIAPLLNGLRSITPANVVWRPLDRPIEVCNTLLKRAGAPLSPAAAALWQLLSPDAPPD